MGEEEPGCRGTGHCWHLGASVLVTSDASCSVCQSNAVKAGLGFASGSQGHL